MKIFNNPLIMAETVAGSLLDERSVVLYEQDSLERARSKIEAEKAQMETALGGYTQYLSLQPTIEDLVKKRKLKELFAGIDMKEQVPVDTPLISLSNFNMWGITYSDTEVNISSSIAEHPIETGQVIMDAAIRNPVKAKVNVYVPTMFYTAIYEEIRTYFETKKKIILLTKFGLYENMVLAAMPYKLQADTVDRPVITLELQEVREVEAEIQYLEANTVTPIEESKSGVYDDTSTTNNGFQFAKIMDKIHTGEL